MGHLSLLSWLLVAFVAFTSAAATSDYVPGDKAPNFTLPTLNGPFVYRGINDTTVPAPIIFHEFTNHSAFLECLWTKDSSLLALIDNSPANTNYVFLSSHRDATRTAKWMQDRFVKVLKQYYFETEGKPGISSQRSRIDPQRMRSRIDRRSLFDGEFMPEAPQHRRRQYVMIEKAVVDKTVDYIDDTNVEGTEDRAKKPTEEKFIESWLQRLHFVTIPLFEVGNWIPLVTSRWYCSGHGCGLDQIAVEAEQVGDTVFVAKRLDARYDWLPSAYTLKEKHPRIQAVQYGRGCKVDATVDAQDKVVVVGNKGCSYATKVLTAQKAGALAVVIFADEGAPIDDMTCEGDRCSDAFKIPASMVSHQTGMRLVDTIRNQDTYIKFQHTPSRNFFFAIDEQGKLQEVGWLLFPSMVFLTYEAEWLNYMTDFIHNVSGEAKVISVFNATIMKGDPGVQKTITMPKIQDLQLYRHVELDAALGCPGPSDFSCPHWDHTVQLTVCCENGVLCGKEIGRWITPFRRQIGKWLTPIRPLIPLFAGSSCNFTMKTVPWAMAWKPSLNIRLSGKMTERDKSFVPVPYKILPLFEGGTFDKGYNKKYKPVRFVAPEQAVKIELVAVITGHGSDDNNCAEFCITRHVFTVNGKYNNSQTFKNAGTAFGCANNVPEGVEPNEHGTWLYGRDGWCDGQEVVPWVQDITEQLNGNVNTLAYRGTFNGTDPRPTRNPGEIIMESYLVYYKYLD